MTAASPGIQREEVIQAYRAVFKRDPESEHVISLHQHERADIFDLVGALVNSEECRLGLANSCRALPLGHYRTILNEQEILDHHINEHRSRRDGFVTDFVGSVTDINYIKGLERFSGHIEGMPRPWNFHAGVEEWVASLRAVDLAGDKFTAVELGAGWAPWLVSCSLAARRKGIADVFCIAVEGDVGHFGSIRQHFENNGFKEDEYRAIHAVVGPRSGVAIFPIAEDSSSDWGLQPVFCGSDQEAEAMMSHPEFVDYRGFRFSGVRKLPSVSLSDVFEGLSTVDLLHIDIQGGEADLVNSNISLLAERVRYMVIGTHSRMIEGDLFRELSRSGWAIEVEKPCEFELASLNVVVDGTQAWRNTRTI